MPGKLFPIAVSGEVKSISDDDLCASCTLCGYLPGEMSTCTLGWPGLQDVDGYVQQCGEHSPAPSSTH